MQAKVIYVRARWKDTLEVFEGKCIVLPKGITESMRDAVIEEDNEDCFFFFDEGEQIIGEHLDFEIFSSDIVCDFDIETLTQ